MKIRETFKRAIGFTLIEILIVCMIIITLISILVPVVGTMREKARTAATRERMATLSSAIETYKNDFGGYYPQSSPGYFKGAVAPNQNKYAVLNSGSAMLAEALIGYLPFEFDGAGTIAPLVPDPNEFGFRKNPGGRGNRYGPYTDAMALSQYTGTGGTVSGNIRVDKSPPAYTVAGTPATGWMRLVYLDSYGNDLLYYKATDVINPTSTFGDGTNSVFVNSDNSPLGTASWSLSDAYNPAGGTAAFFISLQAGTANSGSGATPSSVHGRTSYILLSAGKDGTFGNDDDVVGPLR